MMSRIWSVMALASIVALFAALGACGPAPPTAEVAPEAAQLLDHDDEGGHGEEEEPGHGTGAGMLTLPDLEPAELGGEPLRVVATSSIIGDVVGQVGGDAIDLIVLMGPGQDPHSYEPAARDLTAVANAHVIMVNGWDLEEGLADDLETIGRDVPVVPISANIAPLALGAGELQHEDDEHEHSSADPHVWFSVHHVAQWVENVERVFSDLDPAHAGAYAANAAAYREELEELEAYAHEQLAGIPAQRRVLVTNHGAFGYFAEAYDFTVLGTVMPGLSTLSEPSASDLARLIEAMEEYGVCAIFAETTVSDALARTVTAELDGCEEVQVLKLYTGAIGPAGSGADSYAGMFRANVSTIAAGLAE
jgi:ABC-type Zn uptake system ZnuABC Zn-binding protein ZnuA